MMLKRLSAFTIALIVATLTTCTTLANENPQLRRVTCYCVNSGVTASGTTPTEGRTVGARRSDIGKVCILYRCNEDGSVGDMINIFVIEDTGSHERLKSGAIDVFRDDMAGCKEWIAEYGDYCYVQLVDGKG